MDTDYRTTVSFEFPDLLPRRSPWLCKLGLHDWDRSVRVDRNDRCRRCKREHYWTL